MIPISKDVSASPGHKTLTNPSISIVTVCRNSEDLIAQTMVSVLGQSYRNIEYIIIDGKSSDHTLPIVKSIAASYPQRRILIVSEPDLGIADAMNKGVSRASGKLIACLHAGDCYATSDAIERVVQSYIREGWRWGVAYSQVVDENGVIHHVYKPDSNYKTLQKKNSIPHQSTFLVREIFEKYGGFCVEYKQAMDYEYWLRIAFRGGERYMVMPFVTTRYLDGGKSSNLCELFVYLWKLRRGLGTYGVSVNIFDDFIFFSRITAFYVFYFLKSVF